MKKTVKISGNEYFMQSSAYTQFKYKDITGRKLLDDLMKLQKLSNLDEAGMLNGIDDLIEVLLQITYVMIEEADSSQVKNYEDFLKSIDNLFEDPSWMNEVIELAISPLSRGI